MALKNTDIRAALLQAVAEKDRIHSSSQFMGGLQQVSILQEAQKRLGNNLTEVEQQALLTAWYDLFRTGHLSWGYNFISPDPPFCHVTEHGRRVLAQIGRDPANPDGYLAHLKARAQLNQIASSYVEEALLTYNTNCFRAAAVMVGAAAESLLLELRDEIVAGIKRSGRPPAKNLNDFRIKQVIDALRKELEMQQAGMSTELKEKVEGYWPAFVQQIRSARNDAGHPASIQAVTEDTVHAALLIFPELAQLVEAIKAWAQGYYK